MGVVVQHPVALDRAKRLGCLSDGRSGQAHGLKPDVLCPGGRARRAGGEKQPPVGGLDVAKFFAQRFDESVGGKVGGKLFQIFAPDFADDRAAI
jgi:hypothetical protein